MRVVPGKEPARPSLRRLSPCGGKVYHRAAKLEDNSAGAKPTRRGRSTNVSVSPRRRSFSRPLAEIVNAALDPLVAKRGFGEAQLLLRWAEIVGARAAGMCEPVRLQWPARGRKASPERPQEPATLILRVEPGFGLDIQHMSHGLIERVNQHLGWRCVGKLVLLQEALQRKGPPVRRRPPHDAAARARAEGAVAGVEDDALRAALATLGERVMATKTKGTG